MKKWAIGCGAVAGLAFIVFMGFVVWLLQERPTLNASLSVPGVTELDSKITMVVSATNNESDEIVLDSIDIADSFLKGFRVVDVQPTPNGTMQIFGMRSWDFSQSVMPGDSLEVRFELQAVQAGQFAGDVDVCNPNQDFETVVADVTVRQ